MQAVQHEARPVVMLRMPDVQKKTTLGKTAIYEAIKTAGFPRPRKLGTASAWVEHEVDAWLLSRPHSDA
jgi:prophage regulatory protein